LNAQAGIAAIRFNCPLFFRDIVDNVLKLFGCAAMLEKRVAPRQRVLKGGTIDYVGGRTICTVRNLSDSGAAVELDEPLDLPQSFMLVIERDRFMRRCRPVWIFRRRVGVAFC
jgi:hypothetical protein